MEALVKNIPILALISMSWKSYEWQGVNHPLCWEITAVLSVVTGLEKGRVLTLVKCI